MGENKSYIAIDLKSFYASVECVERNLDPLTTNLVVADPTRTEKTICLAVSPSLKAYGIPGRARLFEVVQKINCVNNERKYNSPSKKLIEYSYDDNVIKKHCNYGVSYITAPPRMAYYMEYSKKIYNIYLKYIAPEDIHIYSIDEVFIDASKYLNTYKMSAHNLAMKIILDVLNTTGITATAGVGTNLYLSKIAMDIVAKHINADENGVRIADLDEMSYRRLLWEHKPITDFWRVGKGYGDKLREIGIYTMGDVALCSIGNKNEFYNEDLLYKLFGVNAELLIDHAWGYEPCTIEQIKNYKPENNSICSGQVLQCPHTFCETTLIVKEMADLLSLDLVEKGLVTDQLVLTIGYDTESKGYKGEYKKDRYGRKVPKHAHGTVNLDNYTSSARHLIKAAQELYDSITNKDLLIRRISITANHVVNENNIPKKNKYEQLDLFTDYEALKKQEETEEKELKREKSVQKAMLDIKKKFGKNALLKGMNLQEGGTAKGRNEQIGGHKA